jgi:DNA-binding GntR family transcriptional regulator
VYAIPSAGPQGTLAPLVDVSLADRAYELIKRSILRLELSPGLPITEVGLAAQLGISKTPVRQAISHLQTEGLIVSEPGRGHVVVPLTHQDILNAWELRLLLEPAALVHAAAHMTPSDHAALEQAHQATEEAARAANAEELMERAARVHSLINRASPNTFLVKALDQLESHASRIRLARLRADPKRATAASMAAGLEGHRTILRLLREGRGQEAAEHQRRDIQAALEAFRSPLGEQVAAHLAGATRAR